jgi:hypothetical protein
MRSLLALWRAIKRLRERRLERYYGEPEDLHIHAGEVVLTDEQIRELRKRTIVVHGTLE